MAVLLHTVAQKEGLSSAVEVTMTEENVLRRLDIIKGVFNDPDKEVPLTG